MRRRFLGDDYLILSSGCTWLVRLANGMWWAFELLSGDQLPALIGSLFREMLPAALEWRAERGGAGTSFEPYRASGRFILLIIRPGSDPWVDLILSWADGLAVG